MERVTNKTKAKYSSNPEYKIQMNGKFEQYPHSWLVYNENIKMPQVQM